MNLAIVGAGIGGLTAGIALKQKGFGVTVFERAESFKNVGTGITLSPNATAIMRELGVLDALVNAGQTLRRARSATPRGRVLSAPDIEAVTNELGVPMIGIHRASLHEVLAEALGHEHIHCGCELSDLSMRDSGVIAHFGNNDKFEAHALVGADGLKSRTREIAFEAPVELRMARQQCWRGVVEQSELTLFPETESDTATEYWGLGARFGTVPIGGGELYWYATLSDPLANFDAANIDAFRASCQERWNPTLIEIAEKTPDERVVVQPIGDRPPTDHWYTQRVVLLGDAVHPTTPNMGQGACMAIESAWVLAECLADNPDLQSAFARYTSKRKPRTTMITERSLRIGRLFQIQNRTAAGLRNALVQIVPAGMQRRALMSLLRGSPVLALPSQAPESQRNPA